jgi:hypothetical protein
MTVREPTPWGTYAVIGGAIALAVYLNSRGVSLYGWIEQMPREIVPPWVGALAALAVSFVIMAAAFMPDLLLVRFRWYRRMFRSLGPGDWIKGIAMILLLGYGALGALWSMMKLGTLLF